jgi:hypothetical protein
MKTLMFAVNIGRAGGAPPTTHQQRRASATHFGPLPPVFPYRRGAGVYSHNIYKVHMIISRIKTNRAKHKIRQRQAVGFIPLLYASEITHPRRVLRIHYTASQSTVLFPDMEPQLCFITHFY